jgi:hypothetical protein
MEAKEKAFELAHKYRLLEIKLSETKFMMISMEDAKHCALIAIDEIIKENYPQDAIRCQYWLDVKHEVSLL